MNPNHECESGNPQVRPFLFAGNAALPGGNVGTLYRCDTCALWIRADGTLLTQDEVDAYGLSVTFPGLSL